MHCHQLYHHLKPAPLLNIALTASVANIADDMVHIHATWLQLPQSVKLSFLQEASQQLDSRRGVHKLYKILLTSLKCPFPPKVISTPRYLCDEPQLRMRLLEGMLELHSSPEVINFQMYQFTQEPLSEDEEKLLTEVARKFLSRGLKVLVIQSVSGYPVLEAVALHGHSLRVLDISFASQVTDSQLEATLCREDRIASCQNLERIALEGTQVTEAGVSSLLNKFPSIRCLESPYLVKALQSTSAPGGLRKIVLDSQLKNDDKAIDIIAKACPDLTQLSISHCFGNVQSLYGLDNLSQLAIGGVCADTLTALLEKSGRGLQTLSFVNFSSDVDVTWVMSLCPRLTFLHVGACSVNKSSPHILSGDHKIPLVTLIMNVHALISVTLWKNLFLACNELTSVDLTPCESMTDVTLRQVLDSCEALPNLRTFIVRGRHCGGDVDLTEQTIEYLSRKCVNLETVGDYSTWSIRHSYQN